jgi:hypothetical protein
MIIHKALKSMGNNFVCKNTDKIKEEKVSNDWSKVNCKICLKLKSVFVTCEFFQLREHLQQE